MYIEEADLGIIAHKLYWKYYSVRLKDDNGEHEHLLY